MLFHKMLLLLFCQTRINLTFIFSHFAVLNRWNLLINVIYSSYLSKTFELHGNY